MTPPLNLTFTHPKPPSPRPKCLKEKGWAKVPKPPPKLGHQSLLYREEEGVNYKREAGRLLQFNGHCCGKHGREGGGRKL